MDWRRLSGLAVFAVLGSCGGEPPAPRIGTDCQSLIDAATRAEACDPALGPLAVKLKKAPDEHACRRAVRRIIVGSQPSASPVRSVHEDPEPEHEPPLEQHETAALESLIRPARLVLSPDLEPRTGSAPTVAVIDGLALEGDERGRLQTYVAPGLRTLEVRHAGQSLEYCVELRACETLAITFHGGKLARNDDVAAGPC